MDAVHFGVVVDIFTILLGLMVGEARSLAQDVFDLLPHDSAPSLSADDFSVVLRFVERRLKGEAQGKIGLCAWCGELDELRDVYPITACLTCHQDPVLWAKVRAGLARTHTCNVCMAPVQGRVSPDRFGTPMITFGDCAMGHTVVEQLEALSELLTTDVVSEWLREADRAENKISRCWVIRTNVESMGLRDARGWVEAHYQDNGSGDPRNECLVCGSWADECTCTPNWCDEHNCSSYECACA